MRRGDSSARDACNRCPVVDLRWQEDVITGHVAGEIRCRTSTNLYFRERAPWRTGTVKMDAGPVVICHIHGDVDPRARVVLTLRLDRARQGVLLAMPETPTPLMEDDPQLPRHDLGPEAAPRADRLVCAQRQRPAIAAALQRPGLRRSSRARPKAGAPIRSAPPCRRWACRSCRWT